MRELTQQEVDDAPEWATHYYIENCCILVWDSKYVDSANNAAIPAKVKPCELFGTDGSKPIPRKEFDIDDCELQCGGGLFCVVNDTLYLTINLIDAEIQRQDAINQAKHFKLTAEDLS